MGKAVFFCAVSLHKKTPLSPLYWEETNYICQSLRNKAILKLIGTIIKTAIVLAICSSILVVAYKGNQPMQVPQAPKGIAYFEFIADWMDAAKTIQPSRCGWGMMLSLAVLGPIYSFVYTEVGIHPDWFLARGTAPDPDIPKDVAGAKWYEVPGIWCCLLYTSPSPRD